MSFVAAKARDPVRRKVENAEHVQVLDPRWANRRGQSLRRELDGEVSAKVQKLNGLPGFVLSWVLL